MAGSQILANLGHIIYKQLHSTSCSVAIMFHIGEGGGELLLSAKDQTQYIQILILDLE